MKERSSCGNRWTRRNPTTKLGLKLTGNKIFDSQDVLLFFLIDYLLVLVRPKKMIHPPYRFGYVEEDFMRGGKDDNFGSYNKIYFY